MNRTTLEGRLQGATSLALFPPYRREDFEALVDYIEIQAAHYLTWARYEPLFRQPRTTF